MENIRKLLDASKHAAGIESDYALAKTLGISKARISAYYSGKETPNEYACLKISELTGIPLDKVIASVKAESEKDEKRRIEWENYIKRLGGIAAAVVLTFHADVTSKVTWASESIADSGTYSIAKVGNTNYARLFLWFRAVAAAVQRIGKMLFPRVYWTDSLNTCNTA